MKMRQRRQFILGVIASCGAPAIGRAVPPLVLWGDGIHDDTEAFQAWHDGKAVYWADGSGLVDGPPVARYYRISRPIRGLPWAVPPMIMPVFL